MLKKTLLCLALLTLTVLAQVEDEDEIINEKQDESQIIDQEDIEILKNEQEFDEEPQYSEEFREQMRDLYVSCIITSKTKLNSEKDQLKEALKFYPNKEEQIQFFRKVLVELVYTCLVYGTQNMSISEQIMQSFQENSFNINDWEVIFMNIDFSKFVAEDYSLALSEEETQILKMVDSFEETMKKKKQGNNGSSNEGDNNEEEDDDDTSNIFGRNPQYEPHIGGISLNSVPKSVQAFYFIFIFVALGGGIYYGYKKIDDDSSQPKIKEKKNKTKKAQ